MTSRDITQTAPLVQNIPGLEPVQTTDGQFSPRVVAENFQRLLAFLRPLGGGDVSIQTLAYVIGGQVLVATVGASLLATSAGDTAVAHGLNRIPNMVLLPVDRGGLGGVIMAAPAGGRGADGSNQSPWTTDTVFVRASVNSTYAFIVI